MIYQGFISSVSSLRQVEGKNGTMSFNTIVVENRECTGKRLGMVFECRNDVAKKVDELWKEAAAAEKPMAPVVEVQFESTLRTWKNAQGEERLSETHSAINVVRL